MYRVDKGVQWRTSDKFFVFTMYGVTKAGAWVTNRCFFSFFFYRANQGSPPLIADEGVARHLPPSMIEAMGQPKRVSTGKEILDALHAV
jgi:hypothetical protein